MDYVLSRDQFDAGDDIEPKRVEQVFRRTSDHLRILRIQDANGNIETIKTTDEHPFYVEGKGWIAAGELQTGTRLSEADGSDDSIVISSVQEVHPEGITVFNLEVAGDHTYFVEDGAGTQSLLWVHNTCVGNKFLASYKGKPVEFNTAREITFFKRDDVSYNLLLGEFPTKRKNWLKKIGQDEAAVAQLRAAGMTESQIQRMRGLGELPNQNWDVHHKHPLILGGDNNDDNFMIFKDTDAMYHSALTTEQNKIRDEISNIGDTIDKNFPMFDGMVIFNK